MEGLTAYRYGSTIGMSVAENSGISKKKSKDSDQKMGKNKVFFDLNFRLLTTFLTTNFVPKGVYRVLNVDELIGDAVRKMGNGAYTVVVALGVALMSYVCD